MISVETKLPTKSGKYLVQLTVFGENIHDGRRKVRYITNIGSYDAETKEWNAYDELNDTPHVSHWQKLPKIKPWDGFQIVMGTEGVEFTSKIK